jgi:hypothetical protein
MIDVGLRVHPNLAVASDWCGGRVVWGGVRVLPGIGEIIRPVVCIRLRADAEYLGKLPDDQFQDAARNAYNQAAPQDRQGLLGGLLGALTGGASGDVASKLGLASTDPNKMSADDAARLMNYARTEKPEALKKTVEEKPWFVKAMGNPVIMGVLAVAAAKMIGSQKR